MAKEFWYQIRVKKGKEPSYLLCDEKDIRTALELLEIRPYHAKIKQFESYTFQTDGEITKAKKDELLDMLKPCGKFELIPTFR